ncbi:MAG TPA: 5'-nucleotidase C-terminal domain-containing protein [Burkholderiales bacterium]|nr:5'-nucleotidase C-terminal domain-containing protein [Burkholderiales bacterium]
MKPIIGYVLSICILLAAAGCGGGGGGGGSANLSISIVDDVDPVIPGAFVLYTITVTNAGPDKATNVMVASTPPGGVVMISTRGCAGGPNGVPSCALGDIAPGGSAQFIISMTVDAGTLGTITPNVSVSSAQFDTDQSANTASQATAVVPGTTAVGMQQFDIRRDPLRRAESAMGNMVADAMRQMYPGAEAAFTNSGGLRQDLLCAPTAGEPPCTITHAELFSVLPFGNLGVILTLTGAQLEQAFLNGFSPICDASNLTGRFPQISGMRVTFTCNGLAPVVTGMWKTPNDMGGPQIPIAPTDTIRFVTNDFMYGGNDGYAVFTQGTNVLQPGDGLLRIATAFVSANSPVGAVVEGRIVGP